MPSADGYGACLEAGIRAEWNSGRDIGSLEEACAEALKQIGEKKYAEGLKRGGLKKVICCGIAFWKKECMVVVT